jgi:hypothetical protein
MWWVDSLLLQIYRVSDPSKLSAFFLSTNIISFSNRNVIMQHF